MFIQQDHFFKVGLSWCTKYSSDIILEKGIFDLSAKDYFSVAIFKDHQKDQIAWMKL